MSSKKIQCSLNTSTAGLTGTLAVAMMRIEVKNYNKQAKNSISAHAQYLTERSIAAHAAHNVREREGEAPRDDLIEMGHRHMPAWAQGTEMTYWKMADKYSKVNACLGKELLITLPYELSPTDNLRLVETFLARLPKVPTTFALHAPPTRDGQRTQYHCHILLSPRLDDGRERTPQEYFRRNDYGGTTHLRLYTSPAEVRTLRHEWQAVLERTLQEHGLALERPQDNMKEIRLTWQEMRHLRQVLQRQKVADMWGHEHRILPQVLLTWQQHGLISARQAEWLAVRGQRQFTGQLTKQQERLWEYTTVLDTARPWQLVAKHRAARGRQRIEATMQQLQAQRHQLSHAYMTWINPAFQKEKQRYREAQRSILGRGRRQERSRGQERVRMDLPTLDAAVRERERQRQQERER